MHKALTRWKRCLGRTVSQQHAYPSLGIVQDVVVIMNVSEVPTEFATL